MFNDTDDGQTQYCHMCEEWAEKYERLKAENEGLKAFKRECLKPVYFPDIEPEVINKYKQALEEVREIAYTTDFDIADIQVICNEVLKDE